MSLADLQEVIKTGGNVKRLHQPADYILEQLEAIISQQNSQIEEQNRLTLKLIEQLSDLKSEGFSPEGLKDLIVALTKSHEPVNYVITPVRSSDPNKKLALRYDVQIVKQNE